MFKSIESKTIKSLDEKLIKYYPEFESTGGDNVTLGDLASMSSGLKWEENYNSSKYKNQIEELSLNNNLETLEKDLLDYLHLH